MIYGERKAAFSSLLTWGCALIAPRAGLWQTVSSRACLSRLILDGCPCPWFLAPQRLGDHRAGAGAGAAAAQAAQIFLMHAHGSSTAQHEDRGGAGPGDLEGPGSSSSIAASPIPTLEAGSALASPLSPMGSLSSSLKSLILRGCSLPPHPPASPTAAPPLPGAAGAAAAAALLPPPPLALALGAGGALLDLNLLVAAQGGEEEEEASELQSWRLHARGFFAVLASLTLLECLDLGQSSLEIIHEGIADCRWGESRR